MADLKKIGYEPLILYSKRGLVSISFSSILHIFTWIHEEKFDFKIFRSLRKRS